MKNLLILTTLLLTSGYVFSQEEKPLPPPPPEKAPEMVIETIEEPAEFPGGRAALAKFLADNLQYPAAAAKEEIQGKVYLRFVVLEDGSITQATVTRGIPDCPDCDVEALRLVQNMPKWTPGKIKGKAVKSYYNLPVSFKLY